ncbi:MAG: ABC transporter permease subunit [Gordonibacter sp.]|uniref:ABC transporter permease subunit n=1 Tax=Gordonibacter sp. TaxID=1968902 RepID=UPI002FC6449F
MNRTLFAKEMRSGAFVTVIIAGVLALYIATIVSMFDPALGESLDAMMQSMPDLFSAFGMAKPSTTLLDFLLNYLYGFLLTTFPLVLVLILVNKLVVRYLDRGTMAYLLATPVSRVRIAATLAGVLACMLVLLMAATWVLEAGSAELLFPGELDMAGLARANAGLLGLWLAMAGLCFLSACAFSNVSLALWAGGGACILSFLVQMVSQVGEKFEFLKYATPLTLFDAYGLAANDAAAWAGAAALYGAAAVLFSAGVAVFSQRDLNV